MIKVLAARMLLAGAISAPFALPALAVEPLNASVAETNLVMAADRIGRAFASLSEAAIDPAIDSAAARAPKGDFAPSCATAVWPKIEAGCLTTADGQPARHVRTITIGYQAGESTTVLVRLPAAEIAQR